jgi:hypothetical protein
MGLSQLRVLRGRPLRDRAISVRSAGLCLEVGALGQVLAQQAVGVLVRAALPGRVRVAEVDPEPVSASMSSCRVSSRP